MSNAPKQLQNAQVSVFDLNSTGPIKALGVVQLNSSGAILDGGSGAGATAVSIKGIFSADASTSLVDSTNNALNVTIRAGSAAGTEYADGDVDATPNFGAVGFDNGTNTMRVVSATNRLPVAASTTVNVSSLGGAVIVRSSAANALVSVYQSTFTDLQANVRLSDRDASSATLAVLNTTPASTAYGAAVRFTAPYADTTNTALRVNVVAGSAAGSTEVTVRQSTFTDLNCRINAPSTANAANYLPVRITDGSSYISPGNEYTDASTYSSLAGPTLTFNNSSNNTFRVVGVAQPWPIQHRTSSGASMDDSSNNSLGVTIRAGSAAGTEYADGDTDATPNFGAIGFDNGTTTMRVVSLTNRLPVRLSSTNTDTPVRAVLSSTATDNPVSAAQAGSWTVRANLSSTGTDNPVSAAQSGTWTVNLGAQLISTASAPAAGSSALLTREVMPAFASVYSTVVSTASSAFYEVISSAAGVTRCVFAERATSTAVSPILIEYKQSTGTTVWHAEVGSGSSGVSGANMAVSARSRLFQSSVAGNVMVRLNSTGLEVRFSLSYFNE
jgi:hypothetical protein